MALLYNRISNQELKERLKNEKEERKTFSFYQYFHIDNPKEFRDAFYKHLHSLNIFGRIYVASEGINAQVSTPVSKLKAFYEYLNSIPALKAVRLSAAVDDNGRSFWVLRIKVREKIVADGIDDPSFDMRNKGKYVDAETFNKLSENPETIIIDMRNHYEYEVGHFQNAIELPSDTFKEQLPMAAEMMQENKDKNIIMYCTGGIRCEKASAFLLYKGFKNVFHLEGGIIHYTNSVKEQGLPNKFLGKNFVFDNRLGERIGEEIISKCHQCGKPSDSHVNCANSACHLLFIQCDACAKKFKGCCSSECLEFIHLPEDQQKIKRKGIDKGRNIFNKSRAGRMLKLKS